jgi:hypothetical protein
VLVIDEDLKQFLESDVDVVVGTTDSQNHPHIGRAWGPRVAPGGASLELFLDLPKSVDALRDLRETGRLAVVFVGPATARSVQLKGRCLEIGDPEGEDLLWVDKHRQAFVQAVSYGFPSHLVRTMWSTQLKRVRFVAETAFDQTPGPEAGRPL